MKKKYLAAAAVLLTGVLLFAGCGGTKVGDEATQEVNTLEGFTLTVDQDSVSTTGCIFYMENQSGLDLSYGYDFGIQKEVDGTWYELEQKSDDTAMTLELYWVADGNTDVMETGWDARYGELETGHYRVIKSFADYENAYWMAGEFTIE